MRTRVKICGITRIEDALVATAQGVDAIGLVFYEKSLRCITAQQAAIICQALPAFVTSVALFKDADAKVIKQVISTTGIDLLQFHGSESVAFCEQFERPYIKAVGMEGVDNLSAYAKRYQSAQGLLLDSHAPGAAGGTGKTFNWNEVPASLSQPVILAGGLNVGNIAQAIEIAKPYAVDISSGVESEPGIKEATKITVFMRQIHAINYATDASTNLKR